MSNPETKKALKNMYNNSLKASYFNNMETNKYTAKSNLQL